MILETRGLVLYSFRSHIFGSNAWVRTQEKQNPDEAAGVSSLISYTKH